MYTIYIYFYVVDPSIPLESKQVPEGHSDLLRRNIRILSTINLSVPGTIYLTHARSTSESMCSDERASPNNTNEYADGVAVGLPDSPIGACNQIGSLVILQQLVLLSSYRM
jgi:hypothetical protein